MDTKDLAQQFQTVYEARRVDLDLPAEEGLVLLEGKYPEEPSVRVDIRDRISSAIQRLSISKSSGSTSKDFITNVDIGRLYRQIYLEHALFSLWEERCYRLIKNLSIFIIADIRLPVDGNTIAQLFHIGVDLYISGEICSFDYHNTEQLDREVAAAKRLNFVLHTPLQVNYGCMDVDDEAMRDIQTELERRIERTGGQTVLIRLFEEEFTPQYYKPIDRYLMYRQRRSGQNLNLLPEIQVPCHYLMQLAVKYLFPRIGATKPTGRGYEPIREMARDFLTVLSLTDSNAFVDIMTQTQELPWFIVKNALYESLCIPFQYSPKFCMLLVERLYLPLLKSKQAGYSGLGRALPAVLRWCLGKGSNISFTADRVSKDTGLGMRQIRMVLDVCAQDHTRVNHEYRALRDNTNFRSYPLIKGSSELYYQVDSRFCGYAFCERLYQLLKERIPQLDRRMGPKLETLVKSLLDEKHIPYSSGIYKNGKQVAGECDIVLEGAQKILFLELKKCPLSDHFEQGSDIEIIHSLADGMIPGQLQALGHRTILEREGSLSLYQNASDDRPYTTLTHGGRDIMTMSVCLPEYSFFTVTPLAHKIFHLMAQGTISTIAPEQAVRVKKFNDLAVKFQKHLNEIDCRDFNQYIHFCCFRSLQQFWMALTESKDVDTLIQILTCDCSMIISNLDFYLNVKEWKKIRQQGLKDSGSDNACGV